jgi:hypothetical protein
MKDSKALSRFFEKEHRRWKKEVRTVFQTAFKEYGYALSQKSDSSPKSAVVSARGKSRNYKG